MTATKTILLTNDEYRAIDAISKSDLDNVNKSPALLEWSKNAPRSESDVANIGTATHAALLEPIEFANNYIEQPKFDMRTKAGKESAKKFAELAGDKIVLSSSDYELIIGMRDSALAHPVIGKLLTSKGESEVSIFFELNGIKCKCRPDRIVDPSVTGQHIIIDVKTSADVDKFAYSVRDYRYDVQDAFYSDGYEKLTGHKPRFLFAVIGKNKDVGQHPCRLFELDEESRDMGRATYLKNLDTYSEFKAFGLGLLDVETIKTPKKW